MPMLNEVGISAGVPNSGTGNVATLSSLHATTPTTVTFIPAATSHTAGDAVDTAQTAFFVCNTAGKMVMICGATLGIESTFPQTTNFRLHLFNAAPTVIADDAAFVVALADRSKYLGMIDLGVPIDLGSTLLWSEVNGLSKPVQLVSHNLVCYLQCSSTSTVNANNHVVTLMSYPMN